MITLKLFLCLAPLFISSGVQSFEPGRFVLASSIGLATEVGKISSDATLEPGSSHETRASLDVTAENAPGDVESSTVVIEVTNDADRRDVDDRKDDADGRKDRDDDDRGDRNADRPDRHDGDRHDGDDHGDRWPQNLGPGFGGGFGPRDVAPRGFGGQPKVFGNGGGFGGGGFGGPPGPMAFRNHMAPPNVQIPNGPHEPARMNVSNVIFELLDMNHDGTLSRDEFQRLTEAVQKTQHAAPAIHGLMAPPHLRGPQPPHSTPGHEMRPPMMRGMGPGSDMRHPETNRPGDGPQFERARPENGRPDFRRPSRPDRPDRESRPPADHDDGRDDNHDKDDADHTEVIAPESDEAVVAQPGLSGDWI